MTLSGANAQRGDLVRNLTTGDYGKVTGSTQSGRLIVEIIGLNGYTTKWERWDTIIIEKADN